MKRIGSALAAVVGVCLLSACGSSGGGDGPMATVITDRPQPITAVPTTDRGLPSSSVPSTPSSATPSSTTTFGAGDPFAATDASRTVSFAATSRVQPVALYPPSRCSWLSSHSAPPAALK